MIPGLDSPIIVGASVAGLLAAAVTYEMASTKDEWAYSSKNTTIDILLEAR